jgi:magnesium chelatase subunit I
MGEEKREEDLIERLTNRAVLKIFDQHIKLDALKSAIAYFSNGWGVKVSDSMPAGDYLEDVRSIPGLNEVVRSLGVDERCPAQVASAAEFILEGLHLHQKLNKEREGGRYTYRA